MEATKEQNYWPGFVDALSNVVLVLVFVLVVFVFALLIVSSKVNQKAKKMVEEARTQTEMVDRGQETESVWQELMQARSEIQELKEEVERYQTQDSTGRSFLLAVGSVDIRAEEGKITIIYPKSISDMDEGSFAVFDAAVKEGVEKGKTGTIRVLSYIGIESYSAARRLAYYRILGLRNRLLYKHQTSGEKIKNQIVQQKEPKYGYVEIIFE